MSLIKNSYITQAEWQSDIFSTTFAATHQDDGRSLLVTQFHAKWLTGDVVERLTKNCQKLANLRHPAIASLLDFHFDGQHFFLIYDVPSNAKPMETVIRTERQLSSETHLQTINQILEGLTALEAHGRYHGHLNFMTVWIVDDRPLLAHAHTYAILLETHAKKITKYTNGIFLSTEQINGLEGSSRSDMFSLGVMLYILLSHRWPIPYTQTLSELAKSHISEREPFQPIDYCSPLMTTFLNTLLATAPSQRFASLSECQQAFGMARIIHNPEQSPPAPEPDEAENTDTEHPTSVSKRFLIGLPLFTIIASVLLYMVYSVYMTSVPIHIVPDVQGLSVSEATEKLEALGLRTKVAGSRFSIDFPPGYVLESRPPVGREVKENRLILLFIAKRAEQLQVPDFQGRSWTQTLALASEIGLQITTLEEHYSATVDRSYVIDQDTTPNISVSPNISVGVTISKGYPASMTLLPSPISPELRRIAIEIAVLPNWASQTIVIQHLFDDQSQTLFSKVCEPNFETTLVQDLPIGGRLRIIYNNKIAAETDITAPAPEGETISSDNETNIPFLTF